MEIPVHIAAVREEGALMAAAVAGADPDGTVPTCPDWTVRDLVRHMGGVHRWATGFVRAEDRAPRCRPRRGGGHLAGRRRAGRLARPGLRRPRGGPGRRTRRPAVLDLPARTLTARHVGPAPGPRDRHPPGRRPTRRRATPSRPGRRPLRPTASTSSCRCSSPGAAQRCAPTRRSHWGWTAPMSTPPGSCAWTGTASPPRAAADRRLLVARRARCAGRPVTSPSLCGIAPVRTS